MPQKGRAGKCAPSNPAPPVRKSKTVRFVPETAHWWTIQCWGCGEYFDTENGLQRYHSKACKQKAYRERKKDKELNAFVLREMQKAEALFDQPL